MNKIKLIKHKIYLKKLNKCRDILLRYLGYGLDCVEYNTDPK